MTPTQKAVTLAETQGGHITWTQLRDSGLSPTQIGHRCRTQGWVRILPQVYRVGGVSDSFEARMDAANLWLGERGHFCSTTAAHLLGLEGVSRPTRITVARTSVPPTPPWLKVTRLAPEDRPSVRSVSGRRVPGIERVLLDLAAEIPITDAGRALDDALRRRLTTIVRLITMLEREPTRGRKGVASLRALLRARDLRDERVRSGFESRMLGILRRVDGNVEADHEVIVSGERFVLDFYFPDVRLGIECHSIKWHLGHKAFKNDVRRHRLIASAGIELLFFTWDEVTSAPVQVEAEVRDAVERRRPGFWST